MFKSKVIIVTGSSGGIGAGAAVKFAEEGATGVVLHGRNEERLQKVKEQVEKAGQGHVKVHVVAGDVMDEQVRERLINETIEKFGRLDVLVNNAGITMFPMAISAAPIAIYDNIFNVNVRSLISITQLAIPHLIKTKGNIVNISSVSALRAMPVVTFYSMSKIAIDHFTRCLAVELGPIGVRVNSVSPGHIEGTDVVTRQGATPEMNKQYEEVSAASYPLRRVGTIDEVAEVILFVASEKARFVTGTVMSVDGGGATTGTVMPVDGGGATA